MSPRSLAALASTLVLASLSVLAPGARGAGASETAGCSWGAKSNPDTINLAYPDLSASYWTHFFSPAPGERLVISGFYPRARYFSFHVYDATAVAIDSAYDAQIAPDAGSSNPFLAKPARGAGDGYTEYVDFTNPPAKPAPNTLYIADTPQGAPTPLAALMYRVYVPVDGAEPAGGVALPRITLQSSEGATVASYGACSSGSSFAEGGQLNEAIANSNWPEGAPTPPVQGASDPPTWSRTSLGNNLYGLYGNQQNAYLTATISRQYGQLVVIHAKAPTFPDTSAGVPAYAKRQVRYWSICQNSNSTRVIACAPDYRAAISHGYYTYVISDPDRRPANATAANGVTWLPWGGVYANGVLILRNMLPAAGFTQAVQSVGEKSSPQAVMGPYFPSTAYCSTATFEAGGWSACAIGG